MIQNPQFQNFNQTQVRNQQGIFPNNFNNTNSIDNSFQNQQLINNQPQNNSNLISNGSVQQGKLNVFSDLIVIPIQATETHQSFQIPNQTQRIIFFF